MNRHRTPEPLELIGQWASRRPHDVALTQLRVGKPALSWTWSELLAQAEATQRSLERDWTGGALIPVYAGKSLSLTALMLGVIASGRTFAGIHPKFRAPQLQQILRACGESSAFTDSAGLALYRDELLGPLGPGTRWWWLDWNQAPPAAQRTAVELEQRSALSRWTPTGFAEDVSRGPHLADSSASGQADRPAVCLFTSGSTGAPKGVLVGWRDLVDRALAECELFGLTDRDVLLSLLPFSFDVGLNQLLSSWVSGARLVMLESWLPLDILKAIEQQGVTGVSGVPSVWLSLLRSPLAVDRLGAHRLWRYLTVSGGSMTPQQLADLTSRVSGVGIFKTYGQTESFRSTALRPDELATHPASVGRPFGSARVYVVRPDGQPAGPGESGEVVHTGLGVMLGYLNAPPDDRKKRVNPFQGADDPSPYAIFTGDQGRWDTDGFLHLEGRYDDLVKIAGNRVHLSEVAQQACALPDVLAAEALGVPSGEDDVAIVVFLQMHARTQDASTAALGESLRRRLPSYMHPKRLVVVEAFPLTASGKVDRPLLRAQAALMLNPGTSALEQQLADNLGRQQNSVSTEAGFQGPATAAGTSVGDPSDHLVKLGTRG